MSSKGTYEAVFTEAILKDAVRVYVLRRCVAEQWRLCAMVGALVALFVWLYATRGPDTITGVAATLALLPPMMIGMVWFNHRRGTLARFRRMPSPRARFAFGEEALTVSSEFGAREIAWKSITEIWERPGYWMLFTGPTRFDTLPTATIPEDALALARGKTRA